MSRRQKDTYAHASSAAATMPMTSAAEPIRITQPAPLAHEKLPGET